MAFYVALGRDRWRATPHTVGPWDAGTQHAGPPSALLGRALERCAPRAEMIFARFTCEILGPIPAGGVSVTASVIRPGRSVELLEATMSAGERTVARASAWRVLRTGAPAVAPRHAVPPPLPAAEASAPPAPAAAAPPTQAAAPTWSGGYLAAMEWRPVHGGFGIPGPATVWVRMRHPLVAGEEPSPLQRVLIVADSGNGISSELNPQEWFFINPELTVHLCRDAVGDWICLDARTTISPGGTGLATSVLSDQDGPLGVGAQCLFTGPR